MAKASVFVYKGQSFMRVIPCKALFHSTTVHEVVNRGDIFCVNLATRVLTVLPGKAFHAEIEAVSDKITV